MKKLGKKVSFLTKILLVFGLLISNLSSLSVVFAYEVSDDLTVTLNEELLEISYIEKVAEEVEAVNVKVYEKYTYLGGLSEKVENVYSLTAEELLAAEEGTLKLSYNSMFVADEVMNYELFDGTYSVEVQLVDVTDYSLENEEVIATQEDTIETTLDSESLENEEVTETVIAVSKYEKVIEHKSGLNIKMYNSNGEEITLVDGQYQVSKEDSKVTVVANVLSGGLNPTDVFEYDGVEYLAKDLISHEFRAEKDFDGNLYGEYTLPVEVKLLKPLERIETETTSEETMLIDENSVVEYEEVIYTESVKVMYGEYEDNATVLNNELSSKELEELYFFVSDSKDGIMYSLTQFGEEGEELHVKSMLDLYNVVISAIDSSDLITYKLLKNGVDVFEGYDEATATQTKEEYLSSIILDDTVILSLTSSGLTITYRVVTVADINNDNALTEEDVLSLVEQVIGNNEVVDLEKSDVLVDGELNVIDVLYLNEIVKSQSWDALIENNQTSLDAKLNVVVGEKGSFVSGEEFTVEYILSLQELQEVSGFAGLFEYDKTAVELVSVEALTEWVGNYNKDNGKFLYYGEESLVGPEESTSGNEGEVNGETVVATSEEEVVTEEYVLLTAKFRALKAGTHTISVNNNEFFNGNVYLELTDELVASAEVIVVSSDDNTLSYLEIAGQEIVLEKNIFDYEITVSNDVTLVDLKYVVTNIAANVTSTVYPEELVEGENTVVITVTSESGINQEYTITVIREASIKEEVITQVSDNYYGDYDDEEEDVIVTPGNQEEEDDDSTKKDEESNLSRIIIIVLILLVIAGLVYLIFRDEEDTEAKKANKDINKLKKESLDAEVKTVKKETESTNISSKTEIKKNNSNNKNKKNNNKKKER